MIASASRPFFRMNGIGNEILVLDMRGASGVPDAAAVSALAARPATRFEQAMVLCDPPAPGDDPFVRIFNVDGSQAEACGNGARCVGWILMRETCRASARFLTVTGVVECQAADGGVMVDMGAPRFDASEIPLSRAIADTGRVAVEGVKELGPAACVNLGNPHVVFWVDRLDDVDLSALGPVIERHPLFPQRVNVSLARVTDGGSLAVRVWERGAGLTKACGSAACAAAVSAARTGRTGRRVRVSLSGGELDVVWGETGPVLMTGPVELEGEGFLSDAELGLAQPKAGDGASSG